MQDEIRLEHIEGFQWNQGNINKNWITHKVSDGEAEGVFFNEPLLVFEDTKHSNKEKRYYALGQTNDSRKLFCAFTIRKNEIRIISARDMSKKEREEYAKATKKHSKIS